jgi:hypothetical protein
MSESPQKVVRARTFKFMPRCPASDTKPLLEIKPAISTILLSELKTDFVSSTNLLFALSRVVFVSNFHSFPIRLLSDTSRLRP